MAFGRSDLAVFTAWYTIFFTATLLAAAAVSYSAPWHLLLPRALAMFLFLAWGAFFSSFMFSRKLVSASKRASLVTVIALLPLLGSLSTIVWAHQLPASWANGPLPLQTVRAGVGSGIAWSDTEDPLNLDCYLRIESRLKEKKLYLGN
jgi:ABC-type transport system involved in multi-copper enzyme maturation permease subunit